MDKNFNAFVTSQFSESSLQEWITKINQDLRKGDYHSLIHHKPDDIAIQPAYTGEGLEMSGQAFRSTKHWSVMEEVLVQEESKANREVLQALQNGANGLLLYLQGNEDLSIVLQNVDIQIIKLRLVVEVNPRKTAEALAELVKTRDLDISQLDIYINHDPLENLARTGDWFVSESEDFSHLNQLRKYEGLGVKYHALNANLFANAGATVIQQLGIALAMTHEMHVKLSDNRLANYWVNFGIGGDYFLEIAKLRAFRRVWEQLASELCADIKQPIIYAETSLRNKSIKDVHNNMIRTTAETMAAIVGGADEILVRSFDSTLGDPSDFGKRIARNQQHILQYESHLGKVTDISSGSYFIERLTEEVAAKAWQFFVSIEDNGGFIACMNSGWLQEQIELKAQAEQEAYDKERKVLIGVNKFTGDDKDLMKLLSQPMFTAKNHKPRAVRPIRVKRLAETFEKEFENV